MALAATAGSGFALGGGLALVLHGVVDRPTEDVDVFGDVDGGVTAAAELIDVALRHAGFDVSRVVGDSDLGEVFSDLDDFIVEWEVRRDDRLMRLSVAVQGRLHRPVAMEVGPVVAVEDLVAWKVTALIGRRALRDYIDVGAVLRTHSPEDLIALARQVDPHLPDEDVAEAGRRLDLIPAKAFARYRMDEAATAALRSRFARWPR